MNRFLSFQQFKALLFVPGLFALQLAATDVASASGTDPDDGVCHDPTDVICVEKYKFQIKDTNYDYPSDAYFVSPDGKETNSGRTPDSPWPVAKAITKAPSGSTIVFHGGTYRNIDAKINKKLTLQAYPHSQPWIKGSVEVTDWKASDGIWRKDNWTYSFNPPDPDQYINPMYPMAGHHDMVYVNGVSLKQVQSKDEVVPGTFTFYVDATNKQLYIGTNPAGKTVEATAHKVAFSIWNSSSGTEVRGLGFAHYADKAIWVVAPRVTLENNTFVWNGVAGADIVAVDNIVRDNTLSYNGRKGLGGHLAHRTLLENNTISYNNVEHFAKTWDAAGVKFVHTDGLISRNNIVENNFATGIWLDESSTNATIVRNTSRYNEGIGIMFEISHLAIIAANVAYDNSVGIMVADSSSASVYNNSMYMNYQHIVVKDGPRKNTDAAAIAKGITWIGRDNVIKNNILSNTSAFLWNTKRGNLFDAATCDPSDQQGKMIDATDYNAYYRTSSSKPETPIRWSKGAGNCSLVNYPSLVAFKAATGHEEHGLDIVNVPTDPFFVDPANGDFRLKPGSPAIGRGEALPPDIASAIGLPEGTSVDLGALESEAYLTGQAQPVELDNKRSCVAKENLDETANSFINRCRKASISNKFPGELLKETLEEIKKGKTAKHKKAWKLLQHNRFKK